MVRSWPSMFRRVLVVGFVADRYHSLLWPAVGKFYRPRGGPTSLTETILNRVLAAEDTALPERSGEDDLPDHEAAAAERVMNQHAAIFVDEFVTETFGPDAAEMASSALQIALTDDDARDDDDMITMMSSGPGAARFAAFQEHLNATLVSDLLMASTSTNTAGASLILCSCK